MLLIALMHYTVANTHQQHFCIIVYHILPTLAFRFMYLWFLSCVLASTQREPHLLTAGLKWHSKPVF
jgi:hypothetical protein